MSVRPAVFRRPPVPPESERQYQDAIVELAKVLGWRVHHHYDARRSEPGLPDLILCRPPRLIFAELKRAGGKPTTDQQAWLDDLAQCRGVECYLWRAGEISLAAIAEILKGGS